MTTLLDRPPYGPRDESQFLAELAALTRHHLAHCPEYARIWPDWQGDGSLEAMPFVHVGLFKHVPFKTADPELLHQRVLHSSSTTGASPSKIALDAKSSALQQRSSSAILSDLLGSDKRPLLIIDHVASLRQRGAVSARVAAAMSLKPLATEIHFLLQQPDGPPAIKWDLVADVLRQHDRLLVYGFTWILWLAWGGAEIPDSVRQLLRGKTIHFAHSGGWKKLQAQAIERGTVDAALLDGLAPDSAVVDFYGLVEQVGLLFPLCPAGYRHLPVWADLLVRDPYSLAPLVGQPGLLQLINVLAWGAPYHSVLTEDMGQIVPGSCPCGRSGRRFELVGRVPKSETRGCANV